jgi:SAM-dependent methyltransferase
MSNGWDTSALAWIESMGEQGDCGDWGRQNVLDPVMMARVAKGAFGNALDVGCGEGRFCRMLRGAGVKATGIDPAAQLLEMARCRGPSGDYRLGRAERLDFTDASFDLVISYITLVDIPDFRAAIGEMARVLRPGGTILIANLTSFTSACADRGWVKHGDGEHVHYPVDRYLDEHSLWLEWAGIRIENFHRPLSAYMVGVSGKRACAEIFRRARCRIGRSGFRERHHRVPWFVVMEWQRLAI